MKDKIVLPLHHHYKDIFGIANTIDGLFVCPGWHPVPPGTTREDIVFEECVESPKKMSVSEAPKTISNEWQVEASKPGKFYDVTFNGTFWKCTCPAASFRRGDCKHIKSIQVGL